MVEILSSFSRLGQSLNKFGSAEARKGCSIWSALVSYFEMRMLSSPTRLGTIADCCFMVDTVNVQLFDTLWNTSGSIAVHSFNAEASNVKS